MSAPVSAPEASVFTGPKCELGPKVSEMRRDPRNGVVKPVQKTLSRRCERFHDALLLDLYLYTERLAEKWSNYHTEGVWLWSAVDITLGCLKRKGRDVYPQTEAEYAALKTQARRCLRIVWKNLAWKAEQRYQSRLERGLEALYSLQALEGIGAPIQPVDTAGRPQRGGLYEPDDVLGGETGRDTLDYLEREINLSRSQALAIVYYWTMEKKSWRAAVNQVRTEGHTLGENARKRLPVLEEQARSRMQTDFGSFAIIAKQGSAPCRRSRAGKNDDATHPILCAVRAFR